MRVFPVSVGVHLIAPESATFSSASAVAPLECVGAVVDADVGAVLEQLPAAAGHAPSAAAAAAADAADRLPRASGAGGAALPAGAGAAVSALLLPAAAGAVPSPEGSREVAATHAAFLAEAATEPHSMHSLASAWNLADVCQLKPPTITKESDQHVKVSEKRKEAICVCSDCFFLAYHCRRSKS